MPTRKVLIYTRRNCCLCDSAKAILERHGLAPQVVDIDRDPQLVGRYGEWVPVVVIDGKERFRGRIDERLLRRIIHEQSDE